MRATNSFCVPLLTYGFGIVPWTIKELEQVDVSTRKIISNHSSHHLGLQWKDFISHAQ